MSLIWSDIVTPDCKVTVGSSVISGLRVTCCGAFPPQGAGVGSVCKGAAWFVFQPPKSGRDSY